MADGVLEIDATALKALAHPVRTRILRILEVRQQVSVTSLAAELGESTGTTSYHLRQLARHGFVEQFVPDETQASGRTRAGRPQRWWRMAVAEVHISGFDFLANSDTRAAAAFVLREGQRDRGRRLAEWYDNATQWPAAWQRASSDSDRRLELNPVQTRALADDLKALFDKYDAMRPGRGARMVDAQYAVYPTETGDRP